MRQQSRNLSLVSAEGFPFDSAKNRHTVHPRLLMASPSSFPARRDPSRFRGGLFAQNWLRVMEGSTVALT
jgi:hypothetical protein